MRKWVVISGIVVLVIGAGYYYHYVHDTPIKRIERLAKVSEELERKQKVVDDAMKYWESGEMQKDVKQLGIAREKYDNAMPWVRYGFYVVVFICGSIILFLWVRDIRKESGEVEDENS